MGKDRCEQIVANVRMEERYAGLSLVFDGSETLRREIDDAIRCTCEETGLEPLVFDNTDTDKEHHEAFYIEFHDEVQRDAGAFFSRVLERLGIDHCANDIIA
jgi:hypothetical protein